MKNILVVGDCNHILLKDLYSNNEFKDNNIDYCSYTPVDKCSDSTSRYYNITTYFPNWLKKLAHPFILYYIYLQLLIVLKGRKYQIIHFHFTYSFYIFLVPICRLFKIKIVSSIWGSDYYHAKKIGMFFKVLFWKKVNIVSITNENLKNILIDKGINSKKIRITRFGLTNINNIDTLLKEKYKKDYKKFLKIPLDKKIIMVGYNRSANQNHEAIINALQKIDSSELNRYFFIFPLTYGPTERVSKISSILQCTQLNYILLPNLLSMIEFSKYTIVTDIFIQLQTSDQFSATMTEHIYCGNSVITGAWLNYDILKERDVTYFEINSIDKLSNELKETLNTCGLSSEQQKNNRKIIFDLCHWKVNIHSWKNIYHHND